MLVLVLELVLPPVLASLVKTRLKTIGGTVSSSFINTSKIQSTLVPFVLGIL